MEVDNLEKFIYAMSQTPNISFSEMKELGKDISGFAITLLFLDAHLAVRAKEETFGLGIQRRVNLIQSVYRKCDQYFVVRFSANGQD